MARHRFGETEAECSGPGKVWMGSHCLYIPTSGGFVPPGDRFPPSTTTVPGSPTESWQDLISTINTTTVNSAVMAKKSNLMPLLIVGGIVLGFLVLRGAR